MKFQSIYKIIEAKDRTATLVEQEIPITDADMIDMQYGGMCAIDDMALAGIIYWLIRILVYGGCLMGAGILVAFIGMKTVLPINLLVLLLFVQLVYIGIRWYVKGWREARIYQTLSGYFFASFLHSMK